jgi:hypothetical protein
MAVLADQRVSLGFGVISVAVMLLAFGLRRTLRPR